MHRIYIKSSYNMNQYSAYICIFIYIIDVCLCVFFSSLKSYGSTLNLPKISWFKLQSNRKIRRRKIVYNIKKKKNKFLIWKEKILQMTSDSVVKLSDSAVSNTPIILRQKKKLFFVSLWTPVVGCCMILLCIYKKKNKEHYLHRAKYESSSLCDSV